MKGSVAALVVGWMTANTLQAGAAVQIAAEVSVAKAEFSLADLIETPLPQTLVVKLQQGTLGRAPRHGEELIMSSRQLQRAWLGALGPLAVQWPLSVPDPVRVKRSGGMSAGDRLEVLAQAKLREHLMGTCTRLQLQVRESLASIMLPTAALRLSARGPVEPRLAWRMAVWVDVFEGGALYRSLPLWFDVACYRPVLQAVQPIAKGEHLSSANTAQVEADVAAGPGRPLGAAHSMTARVSLAAGQVIDERDVQPQPLVRKDARVQLRVNSGTVRLELPAVALSDAILGEVILVRLSGQSVAIKARVTGEGFLEVM